MQGLISGFTLARAAVSGRYSMIALLISCSSIGHLFASDTTTDAAAGNLEAKIFAAWKTRMDATKTYSFDWVERLTIPKGTFLPAVLGKTSPTPVPPQDVTLVRDCSLRLSGKRAEYCEKGQNWSPDTNEETASDVRQVYKDDQRLELQSVTPSGFPAGFVVHGAGLVRLLQSGGAFPLALTFRILDPDFKAFEVKNMKAEVVPRAGGATVVAKFRNGRGQVQLWLDEARAYLPIRCMFVDETGRTELDLEIAYAKLDDAWLPSKWKSQVVDGNGALSFIRNITVTSSKLNCDIDDDAFDLVFPVGAWVYDETMRESYIVRANGARRTVLEGEGIADYARMMSEREPFVVLNGRVLALVGTGVLVVVLAAIKFSRMRARLSRLPVTRS